MTTGSINVLPEIRSGGLALVAGVILALLVSLFSPGGALVDRVDGFDFPTIVTAMADNPSVTHITTLGLTFALLLHAYGLLALFRLPPRQGFGDSALRFGIVASVIGWVLLIVEAATRHMVVRIVEQGIGTGTGQDVQPQLDDLALAVFSTGAAIHFAFIAVSSVAALMLGVGLAARSRGLNVYGLAAYAMALVGVAGLFNLLVLQHFEGIDLLIFALVSNGVLTVGAICFFIFGVGMYRGSSEFAPQE